MPAFRSVLSYAFVASTALWAVGAGAAPITFKIESLTGDNVQVVNHNQLPGSNMYNDDRGGIAISNTGAYYTGDAGTVRFDKSNLSNQTAIGRIDDGIVSVLGSRQLYSLSTSPSTSITHGSPLPITHLRLLDDQGQPTGQSIQLSQSISPFAANYNYYSGVFSGYDSILIMGNNAGNSYQQTGQVWKIDPLSGAVTLLSNSLSLNGYSTENWAKWGVAEYFEGEDWVTYFASRYGSSTGSISPDWGQVLRTRVSDGYTERVSAFSNSGNYSDIGTFTVDPLANRWYFHDEGTPLFASPNDPAYYDETFGYADATFLIGEASDVPAPGALALLGLGLAGVAGVRRRRS